MLGWDVLHNNWVWRKSLMWAGYPPLYFYLYAASTYLFGSGDLEAIRAVSAIAGSLTVVTTYFLGKSLYGKKVGLLSALFLCFFPLHILYSRIAMTEVLMLFFMTTSAYFFWIGYRKKSWTHMCVSGIFLGLSLNTKYIAAVSLVASVLFVVWVGRSWKPLLRRDFLVWLATTLVVIAPVQLKLLQNRINPYWWYLSQAFSPKPLLPGWRSLSLLEFVPRSLRLQVYVSARVASPWLPWLSGYELAIVVLFLASVLYFVPLSLKAKVNPSFLMLFFIIPLSFFAINPWRGAGLSWLVYPLPYYFIMLSSFTVHFLCSLRTVGVSPSTVAKGLKKNSHFLKVFLLTLTVIFGFSNVVVGLTAPIIDKGEIEGARLAMLYIKNRVNQGDAISGWWLSYYLYYINTYNLNVTFVSLEKVSLRSLIKAQRSELALTFREFVLNEHVLTTLKPRFIIISRAYLGFFFNESMKEVLLSNYELVWFGRPYIGYFWGPEETNFQTWLVFERKT
jgi:4-amino-4-deoxy-L-arabinose transferase-like glycosyltransferase